MTTSIPNSPWLIGGPGRSGKTYLAETLWKHGAAVAGFPLEGLFTVYKSRWLYLTRQAREDFLEEYLTRPRYTDAGRDTTQTPAEFFKSSPAKLRSELPAEKKHPLAIIDWILERFAKQNGHNAWAAFDLHPEFRYASFRRHIPGLKLAILVRDAREAISAALYWRGDPGHGKARDARFKHSLILYCLSMQTGRSLARRWPRDVHIFDFNALVDGDETERARITQAFGISPGAVCRAYAFKPHFAHEKSNQFCLPDGGSAALLTGIELGEIALLTGAEGGNDISSARTRRRFLFITRILLMWGLIWPVGARAIADLIYYPRRTLTKRMNSARRLAASARKSFLSSWPLRSEAR